LEMMVKFLPKSEKEINMRALWMSETDNKILTEGWFESIYMDLLAKKLQIFVYCQV
jgi:hypothetical protein